MAHDLSTSLSTFLDEAAARKPTPGGGAVSALAGALAATMGEMVLNYSVNKKGLEQYQPDIKSALEQIHRARLILQELIIEDQAAFEAMSALRKLPLDSPERLAGWNDAVMTGVRVPEAIVGTSVALLEVCEGIVDKVNAMLLSDLAVAADLAMAATRCGTYNVRVNLPEIPDPKVRQSTEATMKELLLRATQVIQRLSPRIWARIEQGSK